MFGDIFSLVTTGRGSVVPGIYWVEAREAAMHSFWHRTVPPATKGLLLFSSSFMSDCNPADCSPPAYVHGIFQARTLEGAAISFSRGSS